MSTDDNPQEAPRPVPVPDAVHDLIRHVAADRAPAPSQPRAFTCDGAEWSVRIVGEVAGGSASTAALLAQLWFFDAAGRPLRETFLPRARFEDLYDEELCALLRAARPMV